MKNDNNNRRGYGDSEDRRPRYGGYRPDQKRSDDRRDERRYDNKKQNDSYRGSYNAQDRRGAGRRVYDPDQRGPRVGRIEPDVPKAVRITGDRPVHIPDRADFMGRNFTQKPPKDRRDGYEDYEAPEIPEDLAAEFKDVSLHNENLLVGRNPIREALKAGRPMEKLLVANGDLSGAARDIVKMARDAGVIVQSVDRTRLDAIYPAHQGMLAYVAAVPYVTVEEILQNAADKGEDPFIIILDGITDPHNLGAIIRSAECAGAHGVIIPQRRSAGLSPVAAKAAAGALDHMPVAKVANLNRVIDGLKAQNVWVIGTAMKGENAFTADLTGPVALVIGSEGDGISRLTLEKCDRTLTLPMKGSIESLNASVAAGILMYQVVNARGRRL